MANPIGEPHLIMERKSVMTRSKHEKERAWTVRKQNQKPHGKVKSLKALANEEKE